MHAIKIFLAILAVSIPAVGAHADAVMPGSVIEPFSVADQHGQGATLDGTVRVLMFSRDMTANKLAKKAFLDKPEGYLESSHAMYLIDVSGMPGFVTRMFAIPKMQKYGYRIFLDHEGDLTTKLPTREDEVTVMTLDGLTVTSIDYVRDAAALVQAVEKAAP
ncbi:MAG: hypothetical protein RLW62_06550 [Gammaproteobacteria bacterium]